MPSTPTPVRALSNHLVINTHNLSQAHNRGSPRSANASNNGPLSSFKDANRPPMEKRHSFGPSTLGPGLGHGHGHSIPSSHLSTSSNAPISAHLPGINKGGPFHGHLGHSYSARSRQSLALSVLRILACGPGLLGMMFSLSMSWDEANIVDNYQTNNGADGEISLVRSDFWVASMWASLLLLTFEYDDYNKKDKNDKKGIFDGDVRTKQPTTEKRNELDN